MEGRATSFKVALEPSEEGGYTVYVPALPGCLSEGDTLEQALQNIRDAIELYLEPLQEPPVQKGQLAYEVAVGARHPAIYRNRCAQEVPPSKSTSDGQV
ncbi:MAG: hypothetical protein KatS3mg019_1103 [Fimbriimonadales bacterium]|nr:MAG: hypothetical protein KatS3mg019_1103 [Fimbriimonadales bacterium]